MVQFLHDLGLNPGIQIKIAVSDPSAFSPTMLGCQGVDSFVSPAVSDGADVYATWLLDLCQEQGVEAVIPMSDRELSMLADWRDAFERQGTQVVVSSRKVVHETTNKVSFFQTCSEAGLPVPKTCWGTKSLDPSPLPVVLKPIEGSGSQGLEVVSDPEHLPESIPEGFLVQEFVKGDEFGLDILNDLHGEFVHATLKKKILMRAGETDSAQVISNSPFDELARALSNLLKHRGNLDVDLIVSENGEVWILEANARFGGGYPFTHLAGCNYLRYIVEELAGQDPSPIAEPKNIVASKGIAVFGSRK